MILFPDNLSLNSMIFFHVHFFSCKQCTRHFISLLISYSIYMYFADSVYKFNMNEHQSDMSHSSYFF